MFLLLKKFASKDMENKINLLKETALLSYQKMDKRPEQTSQQRKYMDGK